MNFFILLLVLGYNGVILWCLKLSVWVNLVNFFLLKGGLLFNLIILGVLNVVNSWFNLGMIVLVDVEDIGFMNGNFE